MSPSYCIKTVFEIKNYFSQLFLIKINMTFEIKNIFAIKIDERKQSVFKI